MELAEDLWKPMIHNFYQRHANKTTHENSIIFVKKQGTNHPSVVISIFSPFPLLTHFVVNQMTFHLSYLPPGIAASTSVKQANDDAEASSSTSAVVTATNNDNNDDINNDNDTENDNDPLQFVRTITGTHCKGDNRVHHEAFRGNCMFGFIPLHSPYMNAFNDDKTQSKYIDFRRNQPFFITKKSGYANEELTNWILYHAI